MTLFWDHAPKHEPEPDSPAPIPPGVALEVPKITADAAIPSSINLQELADELRKAKKSTQAALVEFMADKSKATVEDVAANVHGNPEADEKAVRANAKRTNDSLAELESPLSFRVAASHVFREIAS